jgi:hypothetical protein
MGFEVGDSLAKHQTVSKKIPASMQLPSCCS